MPALVLSACGGPSSSSGSSSTRTTLPPTAVPQAVNAVNLLLDLQANGPPVQSRLARVEHGSQIAHAVQAELAKLQFVGVSGVAVAGAKALTSAQCGVAGVSTPCLSVHYAFVGPHVSAPLQTAYVVRRGGSFVVSRRSACDLAQPSPGNGALTKPVRPAC